MAGSGEHDEVTTAPADRVYGLVADVTRWPLIFGPCLHTELLADGPVDQRLRIWATVGDEVRSWTSRRQLDAAARRVDFAQESPAPPFSEMSGSWCFEPAEGGTRIVLGHRWNTTKQDDDVQRWIATALDRNSTQEVAAVRFWAERPEDHSDLMFSFSDEVVIDGPAERVYGFLHRADLWPQRLPHVTRLDLTTEKAVGAADGVEVQRMEMVTRGPDGGEHTTRSVRLCFDGDRIVYKQTAMPRPLLAHGGTWTVTGDGRRTRVTSRHDVALDPEAVADVFGPGTTLEAARAAVRDILRTNSLRTLERAGAHAEGRD
ncbi:aromatase/cyclase [Micromonospora sp. NPDC002296]|uniref:aromatase/cyclase n=1 Tax=Micromonospora sp. NPDC002296 TaxID=3154271 RepID=UPI003323B2F6